MVRAGPNITGLLAEYTADLAYESLPHEVVSVLKRSMLDTLGTTLAANTLGTGIRELVSAAGDVGRGTESTLIGFGSRVSAPMAAFVNGAMAHSLNYDDMGEGGGHPGATTLPSALAAAEHVGGVSGKEFLAALAGGYELLCRLALAVTGTEHGELQTRPPKPLRIQLWGYFSSAVGAGRVMRLSSGQMQAALGLALMQAAGSYQPVLEGTPAKVYTGFPNLGGVLSAFLARHALDAGCDVFEGRAGLFQTYYDGRFLRTALENALGKEFHLLGIRFKPWPTTGVAHPFIEAALQLMDAYPIRPAEIERVHIRGGPRARHHCEPVPERQAPGNGASAADSIFFVVAKALANRKLRLADFTEEGLRQAEVIELARRMTHSIEPELGESGILEITALGGQRYAHRVDAPRGHPTKPLTHFQLVDKFVDCALYSVRPLSKEAVERTIGFIDRLEDVPDVSVLPTLISGGR
jgi:2-methylcitrate dehydratase PrpD